MYKSGKNSDGIFSKGRGEYRWGIKIRDLRYRYIPETLEYRNTVTIED